MTTSRSKAKGTRYENVVLDYLRWRWPDTERSGAGTQSRDFTGPPVPVEAKHHARPDLGRWVRKLYRQHGGRWMLFARIGDLRSDGYEVVVVPVEAVKEWLLDEDAHG